MTKPLALASVLVSSALIGTTLLDPLVAQDPPESALRGAKIFEKRELVSGLGNPWEVAWGPDDHLWVTERTGKRVTRIDPATGEQQVAVAINEVSAPGGQEGLLGLALHPELLQGTGNDYVYVGYTYQDLERGADPTVSAVTSPYRFLYAKIVRFTYDEVNGALSHPLELIAGLPAGNDHNAGRLAIGPDRKLYYTIGDQGHNQLGNFCLPIEAQRLPLESEIAQGDYNAYVGKTLRLELDGSIPEDNPQLAGVQSHVYTYGHRNTQGLDFGPNGALYAAEHGPKTDDEINLLEAGKNYGWPFVAGLLDEEAYEYARWADASTPCAELTFSDLTIHPAVPRQPETAFSDPFVEPIATLFTVPTGYDFHDPACGGVDYICWPTVGISSVEHYQAGDGGVPGWDNVLLVTALKRGSLYVVPLDSSGRESAGPISRHFQSENRFRDTAVSPDRRTIYIATDFSGLAEAIRGGVTRTMQNPGAILAFTYQGEANAPIEPRAPEKVTRAVPPEAQPASAPVGVASSPPQFTAEQAAAGKAAYNAHCAVCHGNTLTNGTFGTPLAGAYFDRKWSGKSVAAFFRHAKTMPPTAPESLSDEVYAEIIAYIFAVNGLESGAETLSIDGKRLDEMTIPATKSD